MTFIVVIVTLIVIHAVGVSSTIYRFQYRHSHRANFWRDDLFALLTTLGDLFMIGVLFSYVKEGSMTPFQYQLTLTAYFFVVWLSRATLVMTLVHISLQSDSLRKKAVFFIFCTFGLIIAGIVYIIVSIMFCTIIIDRNCINLNLCFCRWPIEIPVSALIVDFIVDTCAIYTSRAFIYGDSNPANNPRDLRRKRFLMMGFSSSFLTLAINSAFWVMYIFADPNSYFLYSSMANAVAAICILTFNIPLIVGILVDVVYPRSQDFDSHLDITLTEISEYTTADFIPPNGLIQTS